MTTTTDQKISPALFRSGRAGRAAALLALTLLTGCAVGPDYAFPAFSLPTAWTGTVETRPAKAPELSAWWKRLGDPELDALIERAVTGNLDVAAAKAKIRESRATYEKAGGTLYPSVDGSGSVTRQKTASSTIKNQFKAGFDASWELDVFGGNRRGVEAAGYGLEAAEDDLRTTLLTMIGDIASNYVEARGYQARMDLARRTAQSQHESAALTQSKFEAGGASAVDVAKAVGQANSTEANLSTLEISFAEAVHRLGILTGQEPNALKAQLSTVKPIPTPQLPIATGVPADVLTARPDVRKAERQLAQYTAKIGEAEAARYPSFNLTGNISTTAARGGDLGKSTTIGWSFGPSLSLPIFNAGQLKAAVDVAAAQRDQYYLALRGAVLTALEDVENAVVSLSEESKKNAKLQTAAQAYRDAATLSRDLYDTGNTSFLEVLDAERSLYSAEDSLISSDVAITTNFISLNKALGGGWDGAVDAGSALQ